MIPLIALNAQATQYDGWGTMHGAGYGMMGGFGLGVGWIFTILIATLLIMGIIALAKYI